MKYYIFFVVWREISSGEPTIVSGVFSTDKNPYDRINFPAPSKHHVRDIVHLRELESYELDAMRIE